MIRYPVFRSGLVKRTSRRAVSAAVASVIALAAFTGGVDRLVPDGRTLPGQAAAQQTFPPVDTALVMAVDVSSSVDDHRYRLQLEGIAAALVDPSVVGTILNGPQGAILFSIVFWGERPEMTMPWVRIASREEAAAVADRVLRLTRQGGDFTCMSRMLEFLNNKVLPQIPARALRTVVDVSGDGSDNCNSQVSVRDLRDEIVSYGTTINGLPILEGDESLTLEQWYSENIKGGPGSFIEPALGFADFGRAIRQKFVVEISTGPPGSAGRSDVARGPIP